MCSLSVNISSLAFNNQNLTCLYNGSLAKKACRSALIAGLAVAALPGVASSSTIAVVAFSVCILAQIFFDKDHRSVETEKMPIIASSKLENFLESYHENQLETFAFPCTVKDACERFFREDIQDQGKQFPEFYFQRARGGGNCFYLSYLSGWLHHLVQDFQNGNTRVFEEAKTLLCEKRGQHLEGQVGHTEAFIKVIEQLAQKPTYTTLYEILMKEESVQPLISYFRNFAVHGVLNKVDKEKQEVSGRRVPEWGEEALFGFEVDGRRVGGICEDNPEPLRGAEKIKSSQGVASLREAYCIFQGRDGVDIQRPEIGVLDQDFCRITMYQRMDVIGLSETERNKRGLRADYGEGNPIVIWRSPNHFDALIKI